MKKVTHVIEASATGTLSMAALLANAQKESGHDVSVIYSKRPETPKDLHNHFNSGIHLIQIQMHSPLEKIKSLIKLRTTLKGLNPEIVFLHSSFSGFLGRISSLFSLCKTKFFYIPHCISFMRRDIGPSKRLLFTAFEWVGAIKKADYIACSESERQAISRLIPFRKCHLIENALNIKKVPELPNPELANRSKTVITVGQIRPQKGPVEFAEIARMVRTEDPQISFIWVGDGDPQARQDLENAGVRVVGWVPKDQVWQYLGDARLYLSTAHWEGMPVSVIEAGFAGLPVVASSCAGNVDVINHEKTGWLFKTPPEAARLVSHSIKNPELSQSIAKAALDMAKQRFTVERYSREMETLSKN